MEFNPLNHHPLRAVLTEIVDFERLKAATAPRLFVSATDVETGRAKIFSNADMSVDVLLASACLPHLFQAVEIDGRAYWDGGYTANPPIVELSPFRDAGCRVLVDPAQSHAPPRRTSRRARYRDTPQRDPRQCRRAARARPVRPARHHRPAGRGHPYPGASKLNTDWQFICHLRDEGRKAAEAWLKTAAR